jgi:hypothetical protein
LAEDERLARHPRQRPHPAEVDVHRGAPRRHRPGARDRAARADDRDVEVVEGGAARRLPRLQPEREGPDDGVGVLHPPAARRARLGAARSVFLDYNQNAKDRTTASAYSIRPLPDARVSAPLAWSEVPECDPADFTALTMPARFAKIGDPHADMDAHAGSLASLLELAARDEASGIPDAPWPPQYKKMEGEAPRVQPSRAKGAPKKPREKMPLLTVANSPDKKAALEGLERWKARHPETAKHLAIDDVLVDAMRGRSSTWTRVRVNLRHVPEADRPAQETPDPDDDPTREWREAFRSAKRRST